MAVIHDDIMISSSSLPPSLSMLIGSSVSMDVFEAVDNRGFASMFGNDFNNVRMDFFQKHVEPVSRLNLELARTVNMIINPDHFRPLVSFDDYLSIPPCMELPILLFEPVRRAFEQGRIEGFGYDPDRLPEEDYFGRIASNLSCDDVLAASDADGYFELTAQYYSDDPELDDDDINAIIKTRRFIEREIFENTKLDPTAILLPRG